jgi:predicted Zn-ribbon and HTH transcriptional regulator
MSIDENNYKTMKLYRCKKCGNVYAASLSGSTECPDCASNDVSNFSPDGKEEPKSGQTDDNA